MRKEETPKRPKMNSPKLMNSPKMAMSPRLSNLRKYQFSDKLQTFNEKVGGTDSQIKVARVCKVRRKEQKYLKVILLYNLLQPVG